MTEEPCRRNQRARALPGRTRLWRRLSAKARSSSLVARVRNVRKWAALSLPASVLLLIVAVALPVITFAAAFSVSGRVTNGDIFKRKGYFLSAAIDVPPASNFGSLGLTVALAAFTAVATVRYHVVAERLSARGMASVLGRLHRVSLGAAYIAAVGGNGVAAYPHQADQLMHNSFAACFVLCALLHFALESRLERRAGLSSPVARATRRALVHLSAVGCATFISHVCIEEAGKTAIGIGKLRAACAEIATCVCFLVYLASYWRSFEETTITLTVAYKPAPAPSPVLGPVSPTTTDHTLFSVLGGTPDHAAAASSAAGPVLVRRCASAAACLGGGSLLTTG